MLWATLFDNEQREEILAHNSGIGSHARLVRGMGDERVWLRINRVLSLIAGLYQVSEGR